MMCPSMIINVNTVLKKEHWWLGYSRLGYNALRIKITIQNILINFVIILNSISNVTTEYLALTFLY